MAYRADGLKAQGVVEPVLLRLHTTSGNDHMIDTLKSLEDNIKKTKYSVIVCDIDRLESAPGRFRREIGVGVNGPVFTAFPTQVCAMA